MSPVATANRPTRTATVSRRPNTRQVGRSLPEPVGPAGDRPRAAGGGLLGSGRALLHQLGPRGRFGLAVVVAVIVGVIGFAIGTAVGRPNWPGEGSADVGFTRDMATHHAQAVEMGMMAVRKATHDHVRSLGYDIATTQQAQIGLMHSWLDTWGVPRYTNDPPMAWVPGGDSMVKGNLMPGMATREQINQLEAAEGRDFDIMFLQLMIDHHLGGVHMVDAVLAQNPSPPVRELAETMKRNQGAEVVVMKNLLAELSGEPSADESNSQNVQPED